MEVIDGVVTGPKLLKYRWTVECPFCGSGGGLMKYWTLVWRGCCMHLGYTLCAGNKPPSESRGLDVEEMAEGGHGIAFSIGPNGPSIGVPRKEALHPCAGIDQRHLHIECRRCGAAWLMACRHD